MKKRCISDGVFMLGVFILAAFFSGCATGTTAALKYTAGSQQSPKNINVHVLEVNDERNPSEKNVLGKIKNGYGQVFGDVTEAPTLLADLKQAFETELSAAGYSLGDAQNEIVIQATLKWLICNGVENVGSAKIRIHIRMTDRGQEVINHTYEAEGGQFVLIGYGTNEAITKATKNLILFFIKDLDDYIKT